MSFIKEVNKYLASQVSKETESREAILTSAKGKEFTVTQVEEQIKELNNEI